MKIRVWDLPTRLFHWLLALSFLAVYLTSRSEWLLEYHVSTGYVAGGLVVLRLFWGFAGNRFARFSNFVKGLREVVGFISQTIRRCPPRYLGHNPLVAYMVLLMLGGTLIMVATGVITYSGEENRGLFAPFFSFEGALLARSLHSVLADIIVVLIVLHISAALVHDFIFGENLIFSMVTGTKEGDEGLREKTSREPEKGHPALRLISLIILTMMGGLALIYLPPEGRADFSGEGGSLYGIAPVTRLNGAYERECTACHGAFHPSLMPEGSWKKIMAGLTDHFGDDASLDGAFEEEIREYLINNSAEKSSTEASVKILRSIKEGTVPLRVTDTPYWILKHSEIKEEVYKRKAVTSKSNCVACHPGADTGSFEDKDIRIPD